MAPSARLVSSLCFRTLAPGFQWKGDLVRINVSETVCTLPFCWGANGLRRKSQWSHGRTFASNPDVSTKDEPQGLRLTDGAIERLHELQQATPNLPVLLRLTVEGGGCSGFQYEFSLDNHQNPDDIVFESNGAKVVSDSLSLQFLNGALVDFENDLMRSGFIVAGNPNASTSCGCGSSFSAK